MADWIPAEQKPEPLSRLSQFSPFVLCAVQPKIGPPYHVIGYYHAERREWRNQFGLLTTDSDQHVTHWQPLPALP